MFIQKSATTTIGSQCIRVYPHIQQAPSTHGRINCDTLQHKCQCLATQGSVLSAQNAHANYLCYSNDTWQLLLAINRNHLLQCYYCTFLLLLDSDTSFRCVKDTFYVQFVRTANVVICFIDSVLLLLFITYYFIFYLLQECMYDKCLFFLLEYLVS